MYTMGTWHHFGETGLKEDKAEAFRWYQRSADAGDANGLAAEFLHRAIQARNHLHNVVPAFRR